jgi:hypothetical protein
VPIFWSRVRAHFLGLRPNSLKIKGTPPSRDPGGHAGVVNFWAQIRAHFSLEIGGPRAHFWGAAGQQGAVRRARWGWSPNRCVSGRRAGLDEGKGRDLRQPGVAGVGAAGVGLPLSHPAPSPSDFERQECKMSRSPVGTSHYIRSHRSS